MKTTLDIHSDLLTRAKRHARDTRRPLRALVEEGLRQVLDNPSPAPKYTLPDYSVGESGGRDPLEAYSWQDLREIIYERPHAP